MGFLSNVCVDFFVCLCLYIQVSLHVEGVREENMPIGVNNGKVKQLFDFLRFLCYVESNDFIILLCQIILLASLINHFYLGKEKHWSQRVL